MGRRNYELDADDDWSEYRKSSKKKQRHRDEKEWRYDKRRDYNIEEDDQDGYEYDRKTRDW